MNYFSKIKNLNLEKSFREGKQSNEQIHPMFISKKTIVINRRLTIFSIFAR